MPDIAISTEKLTRCFGALTAVNGMDLQLESGQFFGFLGPNGAGKSTTIKMLTGLLAPSSGRISLLGLDFAQNLVELKRQIGVVPEGMGLFERLSAPEYLEFVGRMYGLDKTTTRKRSDELLEFMQLADRSRTMIADYSHGMQKKLALAAHGNCHRRRTLRTRWRADDSWHAQAGDHGRCCARYSYTAGAAMVRRS